MDVPVVWWRHYPSVLLCYTAASGMCLQGIQPDCIVGTVGLA